MEQLFYVMAILGCGDAGDACTEARREPVRYHSMQECQSAMSAVLERSTDLSFPVISATCRPNRMQVATR